MSHTLAVGKFYWPWELDSVQFSLQARTMQLDVLLFVATGPRIHAAFPRHANVLGDHRARDGRSRRVIFIIINFIIKLVT